MGLLSAVVRKRVLRFHNGERGGSVSVNLLGNSMLVEYGGKFYDIKRIDNYEGYTDDISLYCKLSNDQDIEVVEPDTAEV